MSKSVEMHKIKPHKQAVVPKEHDTYHIGIERLSSPARSAFGYSDILHQRA